MTNKPKIPSPYVDRSCKPAPPLPPKKYRKTPKTKYGESLIVLKKSKESKWRKFLKKK